MVELLVQLKNPNSTKDTSQVMVLEEAPQCTFFDWQVVGGRGGDMKNKWLVTEARHISGAEKVEIKAQCNETGTSKSAMRASYDAATLP